MAPDNKDNQRNRIPIKFIDEDRGGDLSSEDPDNMDPDDDLDRETLLDEPSRPSPTPDIEAIPGGPVTAELVATRSELKRVEAENADLKDKVARRQADFENYRKRVDRERSETYNRVVIDIAGKLLPVLDNLKRALDAEASVEATESDEFRHFLSGVDLIYKQLNGVLEAFGVQPIAAVGEKFNPHVHEAVDVQASDEHEPDTVLQEIVAGYKLGDKLIRPALVKVSTKN
ncbi:MAG TPA: nucleotide exchange factor GrpE [Pyrinomonadaceae bacterium]|nr:nucleotide exchange factor GrpE [Pyrinomonadaceae bacterium]